MKRFFYIFIATIVFVGCCSQKEIIREVPVEVTHDVYHNIYIHDTTHTTDSTIIFQKGDTVFKEKYKYVYVEKQVHDTLNTHDTIPEPYPVIKEKIVKEPQWWPVWLFCGFIALCIVGFILINNKLKFTEKWKLMQQK